jgi:hypothetical protein
MSSEPEALADGFDVILNNQAQDLTEGFNAKIN